MGPWKIHVESGCNMLAETRTDEEATFWTEQIPQGLEAGRKLMLVGAGRGLWAWGSEVGRAGAGRALRPLGRSVVRLPCICKGSSWLELREAGLCVQVTETTREASRLSQVQTARAPCLPGCLPARHGHRSSCHSRPPPALLLGTSYISD